MIKLKCLFHGHDFSIAVGVLTTKLTPYNDTTWLYSTEWKCSRCGKITEKK
jgi:hypothetical protein